MADTMTFYVINLDGSDERLHNVSQTLQAQGIAFTRIAAFDGRGADPIQFAEYDARKTLAYMGRALTGGELGCYFSHLNVARTFLQSEADIAVVLEDDMQPTQHLQHKIEQLLAGLQGRNWHLINIGANKRKIFTRLFTLDGGHEVVHAHYFPMTTTGIIWNRAGAEAFVKAGLPLYAPVDNFFRDWLTRSNMGITVYPPLVSARDIASDIDGSATRRKQHQRSPLYGWLKQKRLWTDKVIALKHKMWG